MPLQHLFHLLAPFYSAIFSSSTFQRDDGRLELAHELDWPPFDEDEDMRRSIKLDTLYDSLMFCVNKGFRWEYIVNITLMVLRVLEETPGKPLRNYSEL